MFEERLRRYFTPKGQSGWLEKHVNTTEKLLEMARRKVEPLAHQQTLLPARPLFRRKWILIHNIQISRPVCDSSMNKLVDIENVQSSKSSDSHISAQNRLIPCVGTVPRKILKAPRRPLRVLGDSSRNCQPNSAN